MPVTVVVVANVKSESWDNMKKWVVDHLAETRSFDGCQGVDLYTNADHPNELVLIERWDSRDHHQAFARWRTDRGDMETIGVMLTGEPSVRYCEKVNA